MQKFFQLTAVSALLISVPAANCQSATKTIPIPLKPDPPLIIDGDLGDWDSVPGELNFDTEKQVVYGSKWKGIKDLGATVQLCWRQEALFVAATVTDDILRQNQRGEELWKGDHVELYLDTAPESDPKNNKFGARQFQISLSPGNFQRTGDALLDIAPEAYVFQPQGTSAQGAQVAAKRTSDGYILEASLPWKIFNFAPQTGLPLSVEIGISDTDNAESGQGKMMTFGTTTWEWLRSRLQPTALASADGTAPASITNTALPITANLAPGAEQTFTFDAPAVPQGYEAVLALKGRLDATNAIGYTWGLRATLNGTIIEPKRLLNKSPSELMASGAFVNTSSGNDFYVPYGPNFDLTDKSTSFAIAGVKAALLEFRVSDLLKPTGNTLVIKNVVPPHVVRNLVVGDAALLYRVPTTQKVLQGAPTGELPFIAPQVVKPVKYTVKQNADQSFALQFGDSTYQVSSQYSTPEGKWVPGSNKYFSVKRQLEKKGEWIVVRDTFTNLTNENLPLMHRDQVAMKPEKLWLNGRPLRSVTGHTSDPRCPTIFALQGKQGIGLLPMDDVYQVHVNNYSTPDFIGLSDTTLVLKPGTTYTAEWAIVPVPSTEYFDFINISRRLLDTNFKVDGSFAFMRANPNSTGKWSDQKIIDFAKYKDAKYWCLQSCVYPLYKGHEPHGTALQQVDRSIWRDAVTRWRKLLPNASQIAYFHCFLDVTDEAPEKYKDSRILLADGTHGDYGVDYAKLYVPTLTNSYGPDIAKSISLFMDDLKMDGIYWDEMDKSRYNYDYAPHRWDGVSADIDPQTMRITRLKSSVTLLSQPWRLQQAQAIMKRGTLIANGGLPSTRTMRNLHYSSFSETGAISNCVRSQLYSPIALGDHISEKTGEDAYKTMLKALDYGCVYYWYSDTVIPTYFSLTHYMFPLTPIELHEGYIIGQERIITNRSGSFGWNDKAKHEVHVFDDTGREVQDFKAKAVTRNGSTFTELRIAEGWSAVIIRK